MDAQEITESDKLAAEYRKLTAEAEKLEAETKHLIRLVDREDLRLFFYAVGTATAMVAAIVAAIRLGGS